MARYSIKQRTKQYVKGYGLLSLAKNLSNKYRKQLMNTAAKTGLDTLKTACKEGIPVEGEFIGKKMANKIVKLLQMLGK